MKVCAGDAVIGFGVIELARGLHRRGLAMLERMALKQRLKVAEVVVVVGLGARLQSGGYPNDAIGIIALMGDQGVP